ncbi:twin-arginine translocase TatA/TatE family subunit [Desulfocicer vacuolatum]|nr:twin-arginine translocase TatA/TatE family subunit [Desulfocicer vacuolatum]
MPEILLILAIALMVIGPKKLPDLAKTLGRAMGEFKKAAQDFKQSIDVENTVNEFKAPITTVTDDIKAASDAMNPLSTDATGKSLEKESSLGADPVSESVENSEQKTVPDSLDPFPEKKTAKDLPDTDTSPTPLKKDKDEKGI